MPAHRGMDMSSQIKHERRNPIFESNIAFKYGISPFVFDLLLQSGME